MKAVLFFLLGVATGAVCAASGAGGPVLVMPLLTLIGFPAHTAVGISLFNSVFIALPAAGGYLWSGAENTEMFLLRSGAEMRKRSIRRCSNASWRRHPLPLRSSNSSFS